jgi:hypothetical protein
VQAGEVDGDGVPVGAAAAGHGGFARCLAVPQVKARSPAQKPPFTSHDRPNASTQIVSSQNNGAVAIQA